MAEMSKLPLAGPKLFLNNYLVGLFFLIIDMSFRAITLNNSLLWALAAKAPPPRLCLSHFASLISVAPCSPTLSYSPRMGYVTHTALNAPLQD